MIAGRNDDQSLLQARPGQARGGGDALGESLQPAERARRLREPLLPVTGGGGRIRIRRRDPADGARDERGGFRIGRPCLARPQ